ncbi:MAG: hypothetical protein ACRYE9_02485 [Janthinobacterium lividum]
MIKRKTITIIISACILNTSALAIEIAELAPEPAMPTITQTTTKITAQTVDQNTESQKVVDEYKAYVAIIKPEIRDEIISFRKEVAKLNKQKRETYQKLSQEAQKYLEEERKFKKKLPVNQKKMIGIPGSSQDTNLSD